MTKPLAMGRQQRRHASGVLPTGLVRGCGGLVEQAAHEGDQPAPAADPGALGQQHALHVRVPEDGVGTVQKRPPLDALAGVGQRQLVRHLGVADALDADRQARLVHQREHDPQALAGLAQHPALGAPQSSSRRWPSRGCPSCARRRCRTRRLSRPSGRVRGTTNIEMPAVPAGASGVRASTVWTMLSGEVSCCPPEMKNLAAGQAPGAARLRLGAGAERAQVAARVRLGQAQSCR